MPKPTSSRYPPHAEFNPKVTLAIAEAWRREMDLIARLCGERPGPLQWCGAAPQVAEAARHLGLCLDGMVDELRRNT